MFGKTQVTVLEEFCAKKKVEKPKYEFITGEIGKGFVCRVTALGMHEDGIGRSKKEAKHDASANLIKRIKRSHPDIEEIPQAPHETLSTTDAIATLRDLCIQLDHPLPSFEIVQRTGPSEAPEFTAECCVASIRRFGMASTKKAAKQKSAQQVIEIIQSCEVDETEKQLVTADKVLQDEDEKNRDRMRTYREYIDSDIKINTGTLLSERHNYFKNLDEELKEQAKQILSDQLISSDEDRVVQFLRALKIQMKKSEMKVTTSEKVYFIELTCKFDCCFSGTKPHIWTHMVEYFRDMID